MSIFLFCSTIKCLSLDRAGIGPSPRFRLPKIPIVGRAVTEGAHGLREPAHAQSKHAIGQAVDHTVAEAVANR